MDPTQVKTKLIGYGFSLLEGVDPNPDNYVCAGIIHTKTIQIGCLIRLTLNHSAHLSTNPISQILFYFGSDRKKRYQKQRVVIWHYILEI